MVKRMFQVCTEQAYEMAVQTYVRLCTEQFLHRSEFAPSEESFVVHTVHHIHDQVLEWFILLPGGVVAWPPSQEIAHAGPVAEVTPVPALDVCAHSSAQVVLDQQVVSRIRRGVLDFALRVK